MEIQLALSKSQKKVDVLYRSVYQNVDTIDFWFLNHVIMFQ